jgi:HEAT repeat protein
MGEYLPANPSVRTVLMKIINSVNLDLELQREAIHALRGFKSTHIINYLGRSLLNKQDGSLRREAVFTLAAFCDKKALTYILSALKDEDISVADASINSLVQLAERLPVLEKLKDYCRKNDVVLRQRAIKTLSEICLHGDSNVGNASAKILLDYRTISDHVALKDIAIALKGYYPSDSAEIARRLFSVSTMNERQELIELFDAISD